MRTNPTLPNAAITCNDLTFAWPDGQPVFTGLDLTVGPGRSALIGVNGSGKSTLLGLIAGHFTPSAGSVQVQGSCAYVRQDVTLAADTRVDRALGIDTIRAALHRIEAGSVEVADYDLVGDAWDVEERAGEVLDRLGLGHLELERPIGAMSGGEAVLLSLGAQLLAEPDVLLLDEPTNNLDAENRARVHDVVSNWRGALLVVSHDRSLLRLVDQVGDLRGGTVRWYGGTIDDYEVAVATEQEAAQRTVRAAESDVRRQKRELSEALTKLDRRKRYGQKMWDTKREPKVVMGERKRSAQVSAGKHRDLHEERLADARDRLADAEEAVHDDDVIRIDLPGTAVPARRSVLTLDGVELPGGLTVDLDLRGPERIALTGRNGAGKTTLLRTITADLAPRAGTVQAPVPTRLLPQRLDLLADDLSVVENVHRQAPDSTPGEVRSRLARFLFRGRKADQSVASLSGGERFRATLAALLLAEPAPQLLLLDEPTNNLDLASVEQLRAALRSYQGALIIVSHDEEFLTSLDLDRWYRIEDGGLAVTNPN
ncbi:MAG: ABC-F family ATP-binding cassette domain-containing protein [Propionibacteriaceae bacterium]